MAILPPELVSQIVGLAGLEACLAVYDVGGLRQYLWRHGSSLSRRQEQHITDECVDHRWSAGIDVLVAHGALDIIQAWPTRGEPRNVWGHQLAAAPAHGIPRAETLTKHSPPQYDVETFCERQRKRAGMLSLAPGTVKRLWRSVPSAAAASTHTLDILAVMVTNAAATSEELVVWCCQQSLAFATRLGRLLIERGQGVNELRALCGRVGLPADNVSLAERFIHAAASFGRVDLLRQFDVWRPHLAQEGTLLLCLAAGSGSARAVRFLLDRLYDNSVDTAVAAAAADGKVEAVQELAKEAIFALQTWHVYAAVRGDQVGVLAWMHGLAAFRATTRPADLLKAAIKAGAVNAVRWLVSQYDLRIGSAELRMAISYGRLHIAQWMHRRGVEIQDKVVIRHAVTFHSLELAQWLHRVAPAAFDVDLLPATLSHVQPHSPPDAYATARWLYERSDHTYRPTEHQAAMMVYHGELELLQAFQQHVSVPLSTVNMTHALSSGGMALVLWLEATIPGLVYASSWLGLAAQRHSLAFVKWILPRLPNTEWRQSALDVAASAGHLPTVRYLCEHVQGITCTTRAMDGAAAGGSLEIVEYLHKHRTEGCTKQSMDQAAAGGHLQTVTFLHNSRGEGCTTYAMDAAAAAGMLHVVQWLHENRTEGCTAAAMHQAAVHGWRHVVQYLHAHRFEGCLAHTLDEVATQGNLSMLEWFYEHRSETCTELGLHGAAERGHFAVVRFLCQHRDETAVSDSVLEGCKQFPHIHDWLCSKYGRSTVDSSTARLSSVLRSWMPLFSDT
ncbi:hypothetical protein RI367_002729 [Sorochytrium milnesiophthora]